jgi:sialate O-acetylesterase
MACALELGEWNDIHPMNKKDVAFRLFLAAEKLLYGRDNNSPGPVVCRHEKKAGKLYIYFKNCGRGLCVKGNDGSAYVSLIDGDNNIRLPATIESADSLSIDLSSLASPQKVLYAWANNSRDRQLFNSEGLPALPFKIEL